MKSKVIGRKIAASAEHVGSLPNAAGIQINSGSDSIARALRSANQFESDPVMLVGIDVSQQNRNLIHVADNRVYFPRS